MPLSIFGFRALWSPWYFLSLLVVVLLYFLITVKWRHKFENSTALTRKQAIFFLSGMILLYILKGSPVDLLGHILFSVHMTQMAFLLLGVAPLLIMGIPNWVWEKLFEVKLINSIFRFFTKPLISLFMFSFLFSAYHYPLILDNVKLNLILHGMFTATIFMSAIFLWWPLVNTVKGQPKVHGLKKIGYVVLSAILITPACTLIIFADVAVYDTYTNGDAWLQAMALCVPPGTLAGLSGLGISGPEMFTSMSSLYDQQLGGILMKVAQEMIYIFVIGKIFFSWANEERNNADEITRQELLKHQELQANS
ncbi:cytochrome c oxidase assembly factor CtaG [Sporosarcina pasteurii]|uniref:Cytochrome c oxidase assembly factor CtaG n=1 Tax=Sporosarcina pasteurii TaxID=1474 RepID=A0A380BFU9_SPOPA|nr:cytochrome c oxidase assembly factor CtaG [Sporosarcina pasteurii]MDS9470464.1 cytochrome c oxidase assembly factor CtaG [Sporosarcina pasteurii]QBQ05838.1 cytochrome c oxidase assembly factor CtaG [Sporosarcina pasteurii]SUJ00278.1 cytochrome c oxidase assembly factor CtaG [Sporosarcina pasteurii]